MNKKGKLLFGLVILAMVLAIPAVASAKTYDFTDTPLLHKAYKGSDLSDKPPASLVVGTEFTSPGEYQAIESSNDVWASYNVSGEYEWHRFEFKIDEPISNITQIYMLHEGRGTSGHTLYIWNYNTDSWEEVASTPESGPPDKTLTGILTGDFSNYIEGGLLHLLAMANSSSCPYLYVWNGTDYIFDNDIIPFKKPHTPESTDYYRIQKPLEPERDFYKVRIAEELPETSYLDLLRLMTIDHPEYVDVYPDIEGNLFTIKNPLPPVSCVDNYGNDCLELITGKEGYAGEKYYTGSDGEYFIVDFGNLSDASIFKLVMTTDYSILVETAIQTENEAGEWETRIRFSPHEFWATNVFDITDLLPDGNGEYRLRFYFTDTHSIDYIALDTSEEVATEVSILDPVYADSGGDVLSLVTQSDDNYVVMTTGDELFLEFPYQPMSHGSDFERDLVLISEGYYETEGPYTIYTDYVKLEITTTIDSDREFIAPTIDGDFSPGEWTNPQLLIESPIHTYVYFTNDDDFLYVCVDAANAAGGDYTANVSDHCDLVFDTGNDEVWTQWYEDYFHITGGGTKEHMVASATLYQWTNHCNFNAHVGLEGAAGFGASPNSGINHRIYEFKIPLGLLGASPGDTIGLSSWPDSLPYDADTGRHNTWPPGAELEDMGTWGDLVFATQASYTGIPTLSQWGMIAMGILLAAFLIWLVRRRWAVSAGRSQGE